MRNKYTFTVTMTAAFVGVTLALTGCGDKTGADPNAAPSSQATQAGGKGLGATKNVPNSFQRGGGSAAPATSAPASRSGGGDLSQ